MLFSFRLNRAIKTAEKFLTNQVLSGKYGLTCLGLSGEPKFSNEKGHLFSIFFITEAFQDTIPELLRTVFIARILSEEQNQCWGYSPRGYYPGDDDNPFFVDADDTAFALRSLRQLGIYRQPDILKKFMVDTEVESTATRLFTTFKKSGKKTIQTSPSFDNNFGVHPEVNANIYHCLLGTDMQDLLSQVFVEKSQSREGFWPSYFYPNIYYSTHQFLQVLQKTEALSNSVKRAQTFILQSRGKPAGWSSKKDPLTAAWAMASLFKTGIPPLKTDVSDLIRSQKSNGCWKSDQVIWRFNDDKQDVWSAYDNNRIIATANCLVILKEYQDYLSTV
jgi:hypothetical protein